MKIVHFFAGRVHPEAAKVGSVHVLYYLSHAASAAGHNFMVLGAQKVWYENQSNGISWSDLVPRGSLGYYPREKFLFRCFLRELLLI